MAAKTPALKLYTNHMCPWAHRAHIALAELNLPFEEEIIDLSVPRTAEYLKVNPRGLVPSLAVGDEILTESAIVAGYLADAFPSHLVPASSEPGAALKRARIGFFVDTFISKTAPLVRKSQLAATDEEADAFGKQYVEAVVKDIEPLLGNAAPFFGGSDKLTLAEVLTGSFVIRAVKLAEAGAISQTFLEGLQSKAPNFYKWSHAVAEHPSVNGIFDEKIEVARSIERRHPSRSKAAKVAI
ncbi:glutathione S-transferase domain-containing protein [Xylariomycetidae sp. FL2044]|nr:glutathione S-transferase domain-containing protein [Xylariomycetidae sp. FL2044]